MKERPILFSGAMVRAILSGSKTQTRRVMKPQLHHVNFKDGNGIVIYDGLAFPCKPKGWTLWPNGKEEVLKMSPYGQPGDRLWVRETWAHGIHAMAAERDEDGPFVYEATESTQQRLGDRWNPSIHMFRSASRITLEVTGVRVERIADISQADCRAEGCQGGPEREPTPRQEYMALWDSINAERAPWSSNPFVWVVEFKRIANG